MTPMTRRDRRLRNDYLAMQRLAEQCLYVNTPRGILPRFEFTHNGDIEAEEYPDMYGVTLRIKGVESFPPLTYSHEHTCTIYLPEGYPREAPKVRWHTRIFHPNIVTFDEGTPWYEELSREAGSEELLIQRINEDPDLAKELDGYICLDALGENWTPFVGLVDLVIEIANMVRYRTYSINDPLNRAAAGWARRNERLEGHFPLDEGLLDIEEAKGIRVVDVKGGD